MQMLWSPNPRRKKRKLSAAQRAAGFGGKRGKRRTRARRRSSGKSRFRQAGFVGTVAAPRRTRRRIRVAARRARRGARRAFAAFSRSGALSLLRAGAIGGAGAVAVDVLMGQVVGFLPASMQTPTDNKTGATNFAYFAAKAAIALALGTYGSRIPVVGKYSGQMAEGAMTVMAYQFLRPMVPQSFSLGAYFSPAATRSPRLSAYAAVPVRAGAGNAGRGTRAAGTLSMVRNMNVAGR